jgi:hypothetical protein
VGLCESGGGNLAREVQNCPDGPHCHYRGVPEGSVMPNYILAAAIPA